MQVYISVILYDCCQSPARGSDYSMPGAWLPIVGAFQAGNEWFRD